MSKNSPGNLPLRVDALVLVCKACGKRSSGPQETRPKDVARAIKDAGKTRKRKLRVVLTSCMGLCPKRATAVVVTGPGTNPKAFGVEYAEQAAAVLELPEMS